MDERVTKRRGFMPEKMIGEFVRLWNPQQATPAPPFQPAPMIDTSAPMPAIGGGGNMAAIQQMLQMLAQAMAQRQGRDPMASMFGGSGPGY